MRPDQKRDRCLVFVEANTTGTGMLALSTARQLDLVPIFLTAQPARYQGLAESGCQVFECDTGELSVLRATIQARLGGAEVAGVMTTSEYYLPIVAELAEGLGLPGNAVRAVRDCRNKATVRQVLARAGVPQPRFAIITEYTSDAEAEKLINHVGFPCVVKPVDDSGSNDVLRCDELAPALAQVSKVVATEFNVRQLPTARTALVEEYLSGPEVSVETFGWNDRTELIGITEKHVTGEPYFVEHRHLFPAELSAEKTRQTFTVVERALAELGLRFGAAHTEVKLGPAGPTIVEINARLAGGMIPELIRLATGIRMLDQQVRIAAGLPPELSRRGRTRYAGIQFLLPDQCGVLVGINGTEQATAVDGVDRVTVTARPGRAVGPVRNAYDRLGFVVACGTSTAVVDRTLAEALERLDIAVEPETP